MLLANSCHLAQFRTSSASHPPPLPCLPKMDITLKHVTCWTMVKTTAATTEAAVLAKVDYALNLKDNNPEASS